VFQVFLRPDLQNMFSRFSDLWAADFFENIWDIFSSNRTVQKNNLSILLTDFSKFILKKDFIWK